MIHESILAVITVSCLTAACVKRPPSTPESHARGMLCVDGLVVDAGRRDILDVLTSQVRARRWLSTFEPDSRGPLVIIDGREVDGLSRLATIPASAVRGVEILESDRAVPEMGARARNGALLVWTRSRPGRAEAAPGSPPAEHCRWNGDG